MDAITSRGHPPVLNGHNVSNHPITGPSGHDFRLPGYDALPAVDGQAKPARNDGPRGNPDKVNGEEHHLQGQPHLEWMLQS